jgi:proteasome assembly chaperone (PAC2) family protein
VIQFFDEPELNKPILIAAFQGWNDAGDSASFAASHLARVWNAQRIAAIDPEEFYDFQNMRPNVRLVDGETRTLTWPTNEFWAARSKNGTNDILILQGIEPNLKWRTFAQLVVDVARKYEVSFALTFGALLADVPHSRPVPITATAVDQDLIERLDLVRSRYEGPTGIVGVLHDALARDGIPAASLWAAVPHYLAVNPNPKAALALVDKAVELTKVPADTGELHAATQAYEDRVAEIVDDDEDVQSYVTLLEERADEALREEMVDVSDLPSGDAIAEELERFLREHGD